MKKKKNYIVQKAATMLLLSSMVVSSPVTDLHADEKDKGAFEGAGFSVEIPEDYDSCLNKDVSYYYSADYYDLDDDDEGGDDDYYYSEENLSNPNYFDIYIEDDIPALTKVNIKRKGNLLYCIQADGTAEIVSYTGNAKSVKLPSKIGGKKVTKIGI